MARSWPPPSAWSWPVVGLLPLRVYMQGLGLELLRETQQARGLHRRYERVGGHLEAHITCAALHGVCGGAYQLGGERLRLMAGLAHVRDEVRGQVAFPLGAGCSPCVASDERGLYPCAFDVQRVDESCGLA